MILPFSITAMRSKSCLATSIWCVINRIVRGYVSLIPLQDLNHLSRIFQFRGAGCLITEQNLPAGWPALWQWPLSASAHPKAPPGRHGAFRTIPPGPAVPLSFPLSSCRIPRQPEAQILYSAHIGIHDKIKMLKYHPYFQPFLSEGPAL